MSVTAGDDTAAEAGTKQRAVSTGVCVRVCQRNAASMMRSAKLQRLLAAKMSNGHAAHVQLAEA